MKENTNRLLPLLMFLSIITVFIVVGAVWKVSYLGLREMAVGLPTFFLGICVLVIAMMTLSLLNTVLVISPLARFSFGHKYIYKIVNMLFPLIVFWGKCLHVSRRSIERSFVSLNNKLIKYRHIKVKPDELLVLSPHCLQLASCKYKITYDINNCHKCGGCSVGEMLKMAEQTGFHFHVVTGGTLARKLVKELHPKLILAIACERDLASGIQDVYPLPAVGVLNIRPNGPCYNTTVDLTEVKEAINKYIKNEDR